MNCYITADQIGLHTGGGSVVFNEAIALNEAFPEEQGYLLSRDELVSFSTRLFGGNLKEEEPWGWDEVASEWVKRRGPVSRAHFYAGTFGKTVKRLKELQAKVTYTAAAHDVNLSKKEHEALGIPYNYPHLTEPGQLARYLVGYLQTDQLIVPSQHSHNVMRAFGCTQPIHIIPHGCVHPAGTKPFPARFTLGYLGAVGPDKGLIYLLRAWKQLAFTDASLILAGAHMKGDFVSHLIQLSGASNVTRMGWVQSVSDFYNAISVYVQPSITEGFGIEVIEAMAHGRPVICSDGAGAVDCLEGGGLFGCKVSAGIVEDMAFTIKSAKTRWDLQTLGENARLHSAKFTWPNIRERYAQLWRSL